MYHPPGSVCLLDIVVEECQGILLSQGTFETVEESSLEGIAELVNRIEVISRMPDVFPPAIKGVSGSRDNTMNVRVQTEVLPPCM